MARLFISYRRSDTGAYAQRLAERLASFQFDAVFVDRKGIDLGDNYADEIRTALAQCDAVLVLIGKDWLTARDEKGNLRLHEASDLVRREVALALASSKPVIPVMFDAPPRPRVTDIPADLAALPPLDAYDVNGNYFERDADDLGRRLEALLVSRERERTPRSVTSPAAAMTRQLNVLWPALFGVTVIFAALPMFVDAFPGFFWALPGLMTVAAFTWRLYWMGEATRAPRAQWSS